MVRFLRVSASTWDYERSNVPLCYPCWGRSKVKETQLPPILSVKRRWRRHMLLSQTPQLNQWHPWISTYMSDFLLGGGQEVHRTCRAPAGQPHAQPLWDSSEQHREPGESAKGHLCFSLLSLNLQRCVDCRRSVKSNSSHSWSAEIVRPAAARLAFKSVYFKHSVLFSSSRWISTLPLRGRKKNCTAASCSWRKREKCSDTTRWSEY